MEIQGQDLNRLQILMIMTLCIAWVRKKHNSDEICMVADSCFSGGQRFLAAPKIFRLDRNDCAIACAGVTTYSFPVIEHIRQSISLNQGLLDRSIDLTDLLHSIVDITNKVLFQETEKQLGAVGPDFNMIIAGYSWKYHKPIIREVKYNRQTKLMGIMTQSTIKRTPFALIGDETKEARHKIFLKLENEGIVNGGEVDMQPLDVLMEYINNPQIRYIGGYPQMVKIYPFMNVLPFGFIDGENNISYMGRLLTDYETFPYPIINIDTKEQLYMKEIRRELKRKPEIFKPLLNFHNESFSD